jgi:peptide/nickel transport system substrate-binding protein
MRVKRARAAVALVTVAVLGLSACGSSGGGGGGGGGSEPKLDNGSLGDTVDPSDAKGGTLEVRQGR